MTVPASNLQVRQIGTAAGTNKINHALDVEVGEGIRGGNKGRVATLSMQRRLSKLAQIERIASRCWGVCDSIGEFRGCHVYLYSPAVGGLHGDTHSLL